MAGADPILASVLQRRVQAISREMATVLMRTSRSPIFNEIGDLVTVIFDRSGRTLAQTEYASIIANGAQPPLQRIIAYFGDDLHDGDVILHNDVYSGGNQNADVGVFLPIFHDPCRRSRPAASSGSRCWSRQASDPALVQLARSGRPITRPTTPATCHDHVIWPPLPYGSWSATRYTLHAHTQVLGKLAATLAPPEPQLQHAALQLSARGWETLPLPAPDGSGAFAVALDLHAHEAIVEHSDGRVRRVPLTPDRAVGGVTRDVLAAVGELVGPVTIDPTPQEVAWTVPLDEDTEHATYDPDHVAAYFAAATRAAAVLRALRAPYRGRSTPVNAWWGSFDLAVNLFSGAPADPPSQDFIMRNAMDAEEIAVGWWPGDARYPRAAFYVYAHPASPGLSTATLAVGRWEETLGEFILDWEEARSAPDPHAAALEFAASVVRHACGVCDWDLGLAGSLWGSPPPVN